MSGIQSLLAIGAVLLFALVSLRFNSTVVQNISLEVENKVYLTAFSLADDMIEEIKQKAFDEITINGLVDNENKLSSTLGIDVGEIQDSVKTFDDIDDYNGYKKDVGLPYLEEYHISCTVNYVDGNNPDIVKNSQTFYKKVEVTVNSKYMNFPVVLSFIFTMK